MIELSVSIKTHDTTYKQKFPIYDVITTADDDKTIVDCIAQALQRFKIENDEIEDIKIRILKVVK